MSDFRSVIDSLTALGQDETAAERRARLEAKRTPLSLEGLNALATDAADQIYRDRLQGLPGTEPSADPPSSIEQDGIGTSPHDAGTIRANGVGLRTTRRGAGNSLGILA
ncbi:hypothetical protein FAS41_27875 [Pseudomonas nicosulfuronedens]|uniref:Uncharacterized protein n=1 Tax=Pseudomonas nicosulfuronedens TaxID=2571105 RepID=A0A5R9QNA8_9PSED|nr:hypothetical protein [Pseudomonas nicosulfuronedens]TLX70487.1 hypothetical protein FAS41_27875 [Pseudomonas nicosulfuronedens]